MIVGGADVGWMIAGGPKRPLQPSRSAMEKLRAIHLPADLSAGDWVVLLVLEHVGWREYIVFALLSDIGLLMDQSKRVDMLSCGLARSPEEAL